MKRLILLRHAKSDYPDGVSDHERPLAPRGQRDAPRMGREIARRGLHLSCEYAVDPLETLRVRDVMRSNSETPCPDVPKTLWARADEPLRHVADRMAHHGVTQLPVIDAEDLGPSLGTVSLSDLLHARSRALEQESRRERVLRLRLPFGARRLNDPL